MGKPADSQGRLDSPKPRPSTWHRLWAEWERTINTDTAARQFAVLKRAAPLLQRFSEPTALVAFLARRDVDLDEVDRIYGALVTAAHQGDAIAKLATALIWIGLRPALENIYRWRLRVCDSPDAAVSEIVHRFSDVVARLDPGSVSQVVSSLVRNTKRDLAAATRRDLREQPTDAVESLPDPRGTAQIPRVFCLGPHAGADVELQLLRDRLRRHLGRNVDVVLGAAVFEASHREVAEALGIPYQGLRKRYTAAARRLHKHVAGCPQRPLPDRLRRLRVAG